jgi:hypothetical protein
MALNLQVTNIFNSHTHMHSIDTPFASFNPFFLHSYLVFFIFSFLFKNNIFSGMKKGGTLSSCKWHLHTSDRWSVWWDFREGVWNSIEESEN